MSNIKVKSDNIDDPAQGIAEFCRTGTAMDFDPFDIFREKRAPRHRTTPVTSAMSTTAHVARTIS